MKKTFKKKSKQSDQLTAADLFDHFYSVFGEERNDTEEFSSSSNSENTQNEDLVGEISEKELNCAIFSQKNNKSTGTDQPCAFLFKASYDMVSPFLLALFNRLFEPRQANLCLRAFHHDKC